MSLFLPCCFALLIVFHSNTSTSPLQHFIFIPSLSEMEASVENGLRAFPSAISKPLLPLPVSTTPVRQLSLTHTEKITALHSSQTHTHNQVRTSTDLHSLPQQDRVHGGNNHNFNWLLLDTIISLSWRMSHLNILVFSASLTNPGHVKCWE